MLSKFETRQNEFWTSNPEEHSSEDYSGEVSAAELLADVARAEVAYCGDGDSVKKKKELLEFEKWLGQFYSKKVAAAATRKLAALSKS